MPQSPHRNDPGLTDQTGYIESPLRACAHAGVEKLRQDPSDPSDPLPRLLALDLGTQTGWALASPDKSITSGTESFRPGRFEGGGMRFLRFKRWLTEIKNSVDSLDAVYFEEVRRHAGVDAAHAYGGFMAHLTAWCEHHQIPYQGVPVGTIKRHATGKGNADKAAMLTAMRALGYNPADDNEADALALLRWALDTLQAGSQA
jgi:Holliday junction resolvasome RuvABC endonuclease subunit